MSLPLFGSGFFDVPAGLAPRCIFKPAAQTMQPLEQLFNFLFLQMFHVVADFGQLLTSQKRLTRQMLDAELVREIIRKLIRGM